MLLDRSPAEDAVPMLESLLLGNVFTKFNYRVGVSEHEELLDVCEGILDRIWSRSIQHVHRPVLANFLLSSVIKIFCMHQCLTNQVDVFEDWKLERFSFRVIQKLKVECTEPMWYRR